MEIWLSLRIFLIQPIYFIVGGGGEMVLESGQTTATQLACTLASSKPLARPPPRASAEDQVRREHHRPKEADGAVGRALPRTVLNAEHRDRCSTGCYLPATHHARTGRGSHKGRTEKSHRLLFHRQSPWRRQHPQRSDQGRERRTD